MVCQAVFRIRDISKILQEFPFEFTKGRFPSARLLRRCYWDGLSLEALAAEKLALPRKELTKTEKDMISQQLHRARKQFQGIFEKI